MSVTKRTSDLLDQQASDNLMEAVLGSSDAHLAVTFMVLPPVTNMEIGLLGSFTDLSSFSGMLSFVRQLLQPPSMKALRP